MTMSAFIRDFSLENPFYQAFFNMDTSEIQFKSEFRFLRSVIKLESAISFFLFAYTYIFGVISIIFQKIIAVPPILFYLHPKF